MDRGIKPQSPKAGVRQELLDAALSLIREKGYSTTSVNELCAQAGVTKGAFFHHFKSKDALAVAAANYWSEVTGVFFETAPYHQYSDPLDRVLGYLDFRKAILKGEIAEFTCLVGTMVQEIYGTNSNIREACEASIGGHAANVEADIADAMKRYRIRAPGSPRAWRCIRTRFCKGPSLWRRPRAARLSRPPASIICIVTSSCSNPAMRKRKEAS